MEQACIDAGISETGCTLITVGLYFGYFLFFVALAALIVLPTLNALKAPKELAKSAGALVGLIVLFGIAYALSGDEVTIKTVSMGTTPEMSKLIGAGLFMFYTVFLVAVAGLIYSSFHKAIK